MRPYAASGTMKIEQQRHRRARQESCMRHGMIAWRIAALVLAAASTGLSAENAPPKFWQYHQAPDKDGVYYVGPEVSEPKLVKTVYALYPSGVPTKQIQGMAVMAMVIDAKET